MTPIELDGSALKSSVAFTGRLAGLDFALRPSRSYVNVAESPAKR